MGYNHQFYIIAKIRTRYRTVAVANCKNRGDVEAIDSCWRLLNIFGSEANQNAIRHDLEHAARQGDKWWDALGEELDDEERMKIVMLYGGGVSLFYPSPSKGLKEGPTKPGGGVVCPFIQTCLLVGAAYDSGPGRPDFFYPVGSYGIEYTPNDFVRRNQAGCTVIDITDSQGPRYCFMFGPPYPNPKPWDKDGRALEREEKEVRPLRYRPLTPEEYLTWPRLSPHGEPKISLDAWNVISLDVLRSAWPALSWPRRTAAVDGENSASPEEFPSISSLLDLIIPNLSNVQLDDHLWRVLHSIQGFSERLRQLVIHSGKKCDANILALLRYAVRRTKTELDFSPWPTISEPDILQIIRGMDSDVLGEIKSIDLSGNENVSCATVGALVESCPNITTLVLFHTRKAHYDDLSKMLMGKAHIDVRHSDLFSAVFADTSDRALRHLADFDLIPNFKAPLGSLNKIVYLSTLKHIPEDDALRLRGGGLAWSQVFDPSRRERSRCRRYGGNDLDPKLLSAVIPLSDAFLNPFKIGNWLPRLLWFFGMNSATLDVRSDRSGHATWGCASTLAIDIEDDWRVNHLPPDAEWSSFSQFDDLIDIENVLAGEWALVIVTEDDPESCWYTRTCNALRYAFVTRDDRNRLVVCNPFEFYRRTTKPPRKSPSLSLLDTATACKRDEVEEIFGPFLEKYTEAVKDNKRKFEKRNPE